MSDPQETNASRKKCLIPSKPQASGGGVENNAGGEQESDAGDVDGAGATQEYFTAEARRKQTRNNNSRQMFKGEI